MRVRVDREKCMGHAVCYRYSPDVFILDERGYNNVPDDYKVPPELEARTRKAAQACPEGAIIVIDER